MTLVSPRPLEGILVLDLSRILAGPFATMMLGDMGAVVIKVEEPSHGDDARGFGPPFLDGESTYFLSVNRNKRSLALDLKSPEGLEIVKKLARKADVVVENFRPGTAERMGLGYADLSSDNPGLVYVSVSGFGRTGPERTRPGYDVLAQGMGGIMSLTGEPDGPPYKMGVAQADLIAGMYAAQGILLGLLSRHRTGKGQYIDVALLDAQVSLLTFVAGAHFATGREPGRHGNAHSSIAPYQMYAASDGHFTLAVGNNSMWKTLCEKLEKPELADDERFATNHERVAHSEALNEILMPIFQEKTVEEWTTFFDAAGIPAGPILSVPQVLTHPQVEAREMVVEMEHPTVGSLRVLGNPVKLSATPATMDMPPPLLGQHSAQVLRVFLDMKDEEIAGLIERGVIREHQEAEPEPVEPQPEEEPAAVGEEP